MTASGLAVMRDLVRHKWWANAALVGAIAKGEATASDPDLLTLLDHILVADRFWFATSRGESFGRTEAEHKSGSLAEVVARYRSTQEAQEAWAERLSESDLDRPLESAFISGRRFTLAEAITQVALHSQGHRAQMQAALRRKGVTPPTLDFILWVSHGRPAANWE